MTVDDCIDEYKRLGDKIFGHPKPIAKGGILGHKFSGRQLSECVEDIASRHNDAYDDECLFPSDEALCRT